MEAEDVCRRAREKGARLAAGLRALPGVVSVRGAGLLLAAKLEASEAREVAAEALARGLLVNAVLPDAVRLAPPLLVSDDEVDRALSIFNESLESVAALPDVSAGSGGR